MLEGSFLLNTLDKFLFIEIATCFNFACQLSFFDIS